MPRVRLFAAAAEAAGTEEVVIDAARLGDLPDALRALSGATAELARVLERSSFLVDGVRTSDPAALLAPDALVDVMPPFAGG